MDGVMEAACEGMTFGAEFGATGAVGKAAATVVTAPFEKPAPPAGSKFNSPTGSEPPNVNPDLKP